MNGILRRKEPSLSRGYLSPFTKLHEEIDHAMQDFYHLFETSGANLKAFENGRLMPALDLAEEKNCFRVEAELPGLAEEDIKISVRENMLFIEGEKTVSKKEEKKNYLSREISYGRYERSITLPPTADCNKATASFENGTLLIKIPKRAAAKEPTRQISISKTKKK